MSVTSKAFANSSAAGVEPLRQATEAAFVALEERASADGYPTITTIDDASKLDIDGALDAVIEGVGLLGGATLDEYDLGAANIAAGDSDGGDVVLYALKPGDSGITVQTVVGSGALVIAYNTTTKLLVITLPAAGDSDDNIATAINADAAQCNGYIRANSGGSGNITLDLAATAMTGGTGDYSKTGVYFVGAEALPANETGATSTAKWSDTSITVTGPELKTAKGMVATDIGTVWVLANGARSNVVSAAFVEAA